jgi:hypothetical protein
VTPEERERMMYLCERIQEEKDRTKFMELVKELLELMERKERRLKANEKEQPN